MSDETAPKYVKIVAHSAQTFAEAVLRGNSVSQDNAAIIAKALVQADLRGVDSHGVNRIPSYMSRIRQGLLDPKAEPAVTQVTPVVAQVIPLRPVTIALKFLNKATFLGRRTKRVRFLGRQ
jgi:Malate/L-lactate dehydrogenase